MTYQSVGEVEDYASNFGDTQECGDRYMEKLIFMSVVSRDRDPLS